MMENPGPTGEPEKVPEYTFLSCETISDVNTLDVRKIVAPVRDLRGYRSKEQLIAVVSGTTSRQHRGNVVLAVTPEVAKELITRLSNTL